MPQLTVSIYPRQGPQSLVDKELAFLALLLRPADDRVSTRAGDEERGKFFLAVGKYFQASGEELERLRSAGMPAEEVPVVLHIARRAGVDPLEVAELRAARAPWCAIVFRYSLHPATLLVALVEPSGFSSEGVLRFQSRAFCDAWNTRVATDEDIINLVNLKFASESLGLPPEHVIALRGSGWSFLAIHAEAAGGRDARLRLAEGECCVRVDTSR